MGSSCRRQELHFLSTPRVFCLHLHQDSESQNILLRKSILFSKMLRIISKSTHSFSTSSKPHKCNILRLQQVSPSATYANISISKYVNQYSFPVGYLMNEFGFSLGKAVLASKRFHFENCDKPDTVLSCLKKQGFTQTQILKVISADTSILNCRPETTLLPKIAFFRSKGISAADLAKMIDLNHQLLGRSLKRYIIPTFDSLTELIGCAEGVIDMLKGDSRLFSHVQNRVKPNIEILCGAGVPHSSIPFLFKTRTILFCFGPGKLKESIVEVQKMGMDPQRWNYIEALFILMVTPRSRLNEKMKAYKRWGCSEEEVLATFKIRPRIMTSSLEKINSVMSFCVNEIGWEASEVVVRGYKLLSLSLDKRIMPRWRVYQELVSRKLVEDEFELIAMFQMRDDLFVEKYVNCYKNDAPLLLKLYLEKSSK